MAKIVKDFDIMSMPPDTCIVTFNQFANRMQISRTTAYSWVSGGQLGDFYIPQLVVFLTSGWRLFFLIGRVARPQNLITGEQFWKERELNEHLSSTTCAASCAALDHKGTAHDAVPDTAQHLKNCMLYSTKKGGDF